MTLELTDRQAAILEWVKAYIRKNRISPSLQDIGEAFGIKTRHGVASHLKALRRKRKLTWRKGQPRTLRLL